MKKIILKLLVSLFFISNATAQQSFPEKCLGIWQGMMYIQTEGRVKDSVEVKLSITKTDKPDTFGWKTEYFSEKYPVTKDYLMIARDLEKGLYILDEQDGIELKNYLFNDKLYSVFEVNGNLLTGTYELREDNLIFEISFGAKLDTTNQVTNYSVINLQRVILQKVE